MKANEFKAVIRALVIEEVQREVAKEVAKQLPKLLFEMIGQQPKTVVRESSPVGQTRPQPVQGRPTPQQTAQPPMAPQAPRPIKRYAKDPMLNAILNETTPGLPSTPYGDTGVPIPDFNKVGVSEEFMGEMRQILSEGSDPGSEMVPQMQPQPVVEEPPPGDLSRLFNKNFKAILDKSKSGHGGNFSNVIQSW